MSSYTTRRQFLAVAAGAGVAALVVATRPWRALVESAPPRPTAERLSGLLGNPDSARAIGREYLKLVPDEADTERLVDLIAARVPGGNAALTRASENELRQLIAAGMVGDFAGERTAELEGWVLSATEARLCALVALV
jgi:hypothetical protein